MGYQTDFETKIASSLADNTTGAITPAKHREVLRDYLSGKIAWSDAMTSGGLSFPYTRIADNNASPSSSEFSLNTAGTRLYVHKENSDGTDMNLLFNIMYPLYTFLGTTR